MTAPLLEISGIEAGYGNGPSILEDAGLTVENEKIHCIIGPNGAGKSTLLKSICGMLKIRKGEVVFKGKRLNGMRPDQIIALGIAFVPQERALFPKMTVRENLRMGGYRMRDKNELERRVGEVMERFPILGEREKQHAGNLSGGQQQTLAMARTLISKPEIVMLDEPSLGLAPKIVSEMFSIVKMMAEGGITVLLVEQNARIGLQYADRGAVLDLGRTIFEGPAAEILEDPRIKRLYLGGGKAERKPL
ncbi:MAG: ABC transporter ATP-binding protein [Albidovulum sp.]|nr:ABC transporter ATP-binding protein [Albidovulum sp.]MDE0304059.1 ABC transporter ATP-binding protein [Albidovulum sp.]MDE0533874.1 ABC transporter ATP-binding protein [Albidovulum sp.]